MRPLAALWLALLCGCAPTVQGAAPPRPAADAPSLRDLAARRGLLLGTALAVPALTNDPAYRALAAREYDLAVPENAMKFAETEPQPGVFDFTDADTVAAFARAHDMRLRGHTLVWHAAQGVPGWLTRLPPEQVGAALDRHVAALVGHFRGEVLAWDVVNEALDDRGVLRRDFWAGALGDTYLARAFRDARQADPAAALFYNDYGTERPGPKQDGEYELVRSLRAQGVPLSGVGFQLHVSLSLADHLPEVAATLRRFARLGVQVQVTELDVRLPPSPTAADLARQAAVYRGVVSACLHEPACTAVLTWGVADRYSWQREAAPLPFGEALQPKPAARAVAQALQGS